MNRNNMESKGTRTAYRLLMTVFMVTLVASVASAQEGAADNEHTTETMAKLAAGIALAGCGIGTGMSQGPIGAAAVGMISEDSSKFVSGLIFTALPETIVLFGFLALFLL
ncbi:MAG: V-type ATP synthase subunit K [Candidatus Thalassarchaeaceae archaeon]|jgi:V/A-type H+-transporting ATPase subunit K|tara:strand:+ start:4285 stop:4614 length:330 start_codon:yes stop_codon:yes gene_type:complete